MKIYKYRIYTALTQELELPSSVKFLDIQVIDDKLFLWAEVDTDALGEAWIISMYFTGDIKDSTSQTYIKTVCHRDLVLHFYASRSYS